MDLEKEFQVFFSSLLKFVLEEKLATKFNLKAEKTIQYEKSISDITVSFELSKDNFNKKIYYFIDKKLMLNLTKEFINEIDALDFSLDLFLSVITELNSYILKNKLPEKVIIKKKATGKLENEYNISKLEIVKGYIDLAENEKVKLLVLPLTSAKGDISIGFAQGIVKENTTSSNNSNNSSNKINVIKSKDNKEDFSANMMLSAVQLIELKRAVLTSLNEIKDLRGDNEFLLRKSKTVAELTKLWFEILKEENNN